MSFLTIYTFQDEIVRMFESEYSILYGNHFSRIPIYTYISFNGPVAPNYHILTSSQQSSPEGVAWSKYLQLFVPQTRPWRHWLSWSQSPPPMSQGLSWVQQRLLTPWEPTQFNPALLWKRERENIFLRTSCFFYNTYMQYDIAKTNSKRMVSQNRIADG